jgi:hypothetical protein
LRRAVQQIRNTRELGFIRPDLNPYLLELGEGNREADGKSRRVERGASISARYSSLLAFKTTAAKRGSYSVCCWYGPMAAAPRIQFCGVAWSQVFGGDAERPLSVARHPYVELRTLRQNALLRIAIAVVGLAIRRLAAKIVEFGVQNAPALS